jgi:hypothetical protein
MGRHSPLNDSALPATAGLAHAIASFAHSDGDYTTAISALSLHRRKGARTLTRVTPVASWAMKVPRSSVASTADYSARRPSKMSGVCG